MKRKDITALAEKSVSELQQQLRDLQLQLTKLTMEMSVGKVNDVRQSSKISDDIARIKTVLREKELKEI